VPPLLAGLIDDGAVIPPCPTSFAEAVVAHRGHRSAWYADAVGPLLLPASSIGNALALIASGEPIPVGVVGDTGPSPGGLAQLASALVAVGGRLAVRHVEVPVAMRGDDPLPGLIAVLDLARSVNSDLDGDAGISFYAEIPLTWGVLASLDTLAEARARGAAVAAKFRTGGLAVELFPTPVELAAVICACRDRELPFKLTSGLHRGVRRTDPETGLVNHGFLNVLAAVLSAAAGAEAADIAELLGGTDPMTLTAAIRVGVDGPRPFWRGFAVCDVGEPLSDLRSVGLLPASPRTMA
jgi:hypothetical protein